jgi:hypothetical protein
MKKLILSILFLVAVNVAFSQDYSSFGKKIKAKKAQPISSISASNVSEKPVKLEGEVESVCQVKGCWMKVKMADGSLMRVSFKDYGFFMPKDIAGQKVIMEGVAAVKTTSLADLKHYAEDAGKSPEEIAKITEPKTELTFVADGVLVPKK